MDVLNEGVHIRVREVDLRQSRLRSAAELQLTIAMKASLVYLSYTTALQDARLVGVSRTSNAAGTEALVADCPPLFALESPPLLVLGSCLTTCWVSNALDSPPLFALEFWTIACRVSVSFDRPPLFALESRLIASWVSTVPDYPPLFALEPPPLIGLESRLIASEFSVVIWIASGNSSRISSTKSLYSIATSCANQASTSSPNNLSIYLLWFYDM
jgi:hypothetical protein